MNRGSHVEGERQTKPRTGQTGGDYCRWVKSCDFSKERKFHQVLLRVTALVVKKVVHFVPESRNVYQIKFNFRTKQINQYKIVLSKNLALRRPSQSGSLCEEGGFMLRLEQSDCGQWVV
eukprot:2484656-Rhodomonas_salina.2